METLSEVDKKFIDIPYKFGGNSFDGTDCMGLILLWYREHGIEFEYEESIAMKLRAFWERRPAEFVSLISSYGDFVPFNEIKKYDFLLFYRERREAVFPSFPAVMVDDRHFIASFEETKSRVYMIDMDWKNRFWGAIKVRKAVEMGIR